MTSKQTISAVVAFDQEGNWTEHKTPENLAKSISIEAAKLLRCYQWNPEPDAQQVRQELADVLTYCLQLAHRIGADPDQIVMEKLEVKSKNYPTDKADDIRENTRGRRDGGTQLYGFELDRDDKSGQKGLIG